MSFNTKRPRIIVIGGGIRGASLAAFLTATDLFEIVLIEKDSVGSGGSSCTNHGRFHLGTWNYHTNSSDAVARFRLSSEIIKSFPNVLTTSKQGFYCIEDEADIEGFVHFCQTHNIPYQKAEINEEYASWLNASSVSTVFEIPEFAFNPARLSAQLIETAKNTDFFQLIIAEAVDVSNVSDTFKVSLKDGRIIEGDIVISALGAWTNTLSTNFNVPQLPISLKSWKLLCLRSDSCLDRTVTIDRKTAGPIGIIPHDGWVVIGADVEPNILHSPEEIDVKNSWHKYEPNNNMDRTLLTAGVNYVPILRSLLLNRDYSNLFSFTGVYPEIIDERKGEKVITPYPEARLLQNEQTPRFFVIFGGSATSALYDAQKICREICTYLGLRPDTRMLVQRICSRFPRKKQLGNGMIWEMSD